MAKPAWRTCLSTSSSRARRIIPNIDDELTERGAFPNGTTWLDRTNYFETFPANEDNLAWALDLEADRMINSFISAEDLESEMTVVRNEMESGENNPSRILSARVASAAYLWHNYGNSTIGARSDVENVPIDRLQAFYRKYYQPDNAVLVVAGKFEPERAVELVAQEFGPIPRPDRSGNNQIFPTYTAEPAQDGERTVSLRRVGDVQIAMAAFHVPAGSHEDFAAAKVLNHILGNEPAGRLYTNLVEPGLAARVSSYAMQMREPGLLIGDAEVRLEDSLDAATEALLATFDELAAEPPTEEEVERAKTYYRSNIELAFNNPQFIALSLSEWAAMGDWRLIFIDRDRLEQVTPEDVHRVAQTYLMQSNRTLGFFHPTDETPVRAEVPPPPVVAEVVEGYTGREAVAEGEAFDPTPQNIEARTRKITLSGGMKVAMLAKENRGDAVSVRFTFRGGNEEALMGKATAAQIAASMLMRGTENRSRQEISDEMDRLKTQSSLSGSIFGAGGSLVTVRESLPEVLRLGAEVLKQPAFDQAEFDTLRQEILAGIESQRSEPQALVSVAMQRHIGPRESADHPLYTPTFDEQIERLNAVTIEDARAFHEGRLWRRSRNPRPRRRLRPRRNRPPARRTVRRLGRRRTLQARRRPSRSSGNRQHRHRNPGQGQRVHARGDDIPDVRLAPRLRRHDPRQLHARRRFPELPPGQAHPPGRGPLLRRRLPVPSPPHRRIGRLPHLRHLLP